MRRRDFIIYSAAMAAWPLVPRAQQAGMPVIGYLCPQTPAAFVSRLRAFRQGFEETGYVEGRNVAIEFRWAEGQHDRLRALAADLVSRQVALIVAPGGAPAAIAAKSVTTSIPIVFEMGADPIAMGLVDSLSRPGGNLTGVSSLSVEVTPKRLEFLRTAVPTAASIAVLINPTSPTAGSQLTSLRTMAGATGLQLHTLSASTVGELEAVSASLLKLRPDGLVFTSDTFFGTNAERFAALTVRHGIPAIHQSRDFVIAGGLMSYGGSFLESHRQAGIYAGRVLSGAKPADLPVRQVTKIELLINLKAAKTLGIEFPISLSVLADIAIE
ncbi:MAG TPA: ABC transporter substrate-binding protein [Hyphomicrobiaceae bacterium]|nr:ABC transporter substrate-binding protein [Hyphomicrobiaceae bacterium]